MHIYLHNMSKKTEYIEELKSFVNGSKSQLISLMDAFSFMPSINRCISPNSSSYKMNNHQFGNEEPTMDGIISSLTEHLSKLRSCSITSGPQLPSPVPQLFLSHEKLACNIDSDTRRKLLEPLRDTEPIPAPAVSPDEYQANYSSFEKNVLYEHALRNTVKIQAPPELSLPEAADGKTVADDKELTEEERYVRKLEVLKRERDLKRRRTAYRKKVSTKNKTQTEVTKEIISNMMEALFFDKFEETSTEQSFRSGRSSDRRDNEGRSESPEDTHDYKYRRKEADAKSEDYKKRTDRENFRSYGDKERGRRENRKKERNRNGGKYEGGDGERYLNKYCEYKYRKSDKEERYCKSKYNDAYHTRERYSERERGDNKRKTDDVSPSPSENQRERRKRKKQRRRPSSERSCDQSFGRKSYRNK